jgi:predicted lipoprotein with Yx(FWY)xxD motif
MTGCRIIRLLAPVALAAAGALTVAACGGGDQAPGRLAAKPSTRQATVSVASSKLGRLLVDSHGRTLYLFEADAGMTSSCFGGCATAWPPLRTGDKPTVADGAHASLVATIARPDGGREVTYHGHPLYLYAGDTEPGQVNGQGVSAFGAKWFAMSPIGTAIRTQPSSTASNGVYQPTATT